MLLKSYFSISESEECLNFGYSLVRDVLTAVRRTDLGRSLGAYVVQCRSVKDIEPPIVSKRFCIVAGNFDVWWFHFF